MPAETKKQKEWNKMKSKVDSWGDGLGYPVDRGIKEAVIVWNLLGFPTESSCEGHLGHGEPFSWLRFNVIRSLAYRKEKIILEKIYKKIKLKTKNEISKKYNKKENLWSDDIYSEWNRVFYYTLKSYQDKEYKEALEKINKNNIVLQAKISNELKEFYKKTAPGDVPYKVGFFDLEHVVELVPKKVSKFKNKKDKRIFLLESRKEMRGITHFLKNKFFKAA